MQSSKYSPKESGSSRNQTTKTAVVKKAPAAKQAPAARQAPAAKKAPAVKKAPAMQKAPVAKMPGNRKNVIFQVQTKPGSKVYIAGDFNAWNHREKELCDDDGNGLYQVAVELEPGTYEYKFHINDSWCVDPENPKFNQNSMGTLNSVIIVEE